MAELTNISSALEQYSLMSKSRQIPRRHHCDRCLRTKLKSSPHEGQLDSEVFLGDHHACDLQGPFSPAKITDNLYKCSIIEYKSKYVKMSFIKRKYDVNKCIDDYCRHEQDIFTIDGDEAASIEVEDIMARHNAVYKKTLAYTAEQNSLIEHVWGL